MGFEMPQAGRTCSAVAQAMLCLSLGPAQAMSVAPPTGCALLHEAATPVCTAKLTCPDDPALISAARQMFAACAEGAPVPVAEVDALIAAFGGPDIFRCCAGNALRLQFPLPRS